MAEGKPTDVKESLDLVEQAEQADAGENGIAADDGGMSSVVQKAATLQDGEDAGEEPRASRPL